VKFQTYNGDSLEILKSFPENSFDSLVTDPPAGIGLMGLEWDKDKGGRDQWIQWMSSIMSECYRVLKPGAFGFVWAIPRTSHWTAMALENSGFYIKDVVVHLFGNGFPKNIAIDKALDKAKYSDTDLIYQVTAWIRNRRDELGLTNREIDELAVVRGCASHWTAGPENAQPHIPTKERWEKLEPVLGSPPDWMKSLIRTSNENGENWKERKVVGIYSKESGGLNGISFKSTDKNITEPTNEDSIKWRGWGTALKPASEHWILIQKPISEHNIAANIKKHSTGGINIDDTRIPVIGEKIPSTSYLKFGGEDTFLWNTKKRNENCEYSQHPKGRFPTNAILTKSGSGELEKIINQQSDRDNVDVTEYFFKLNLEAPFYYCKRADSKERGPGNIHPTVKPINLMRYLSKQVTPLGGIVLDPFMGSGTTGVASLLEGFRFHGIELNEEYFKIANQRLKEVKND